MNRLQINFSNKVFEPQPCGALFWPEENMLIVSDLHLEKGTSYLPFGSFLPPYDTSETLDKLKGTCDRLKPKTLLFLGDIYHDNGAYIRMNAQDKRTWDDLLARYNILWIEGNHDPDSAPENIECHRSYKLKEISFIHITTDKTYPEISGHFHPAAVIKHKGQKIRRPCFMVSKSKVILPSYGAFTGGLNVDDDAFKNLKLGDVDLYALGSDRVFKVPL